MILSNGAIHNAMDKGWLKIDPEPMPRYLELGKECPYQTSSVDLTLGNEISFIDPDPDQGLPISIDLRKGKFAKLFTPYSKSHHISEEQPYLLKPGKLVLGKTREKITLPIPSNGEEPQPPCLAARVEGKSSFARCGLLVHFTAPTIHAGFSGTITLELINFGPLSIGLYPDMAICQLIIEEVKGVPFRNDSQFQNQTQAGGNMG